MADQMPAASANRNTGPAGTRPIAGMPSQGMNLGSENLNPAAQRQAGRTFQQNNLAGQKQAKPQVAKPRTTQAKSLGPENLKDGKTQNLAKRTLSQSQRAAVKENPPKSAESFTSIDEDSEYDEFNEAATKAASDVNTLQSLKDKAERAVEMYNFSIFLTCTMLALTKDICDFMEMGIFYNWVVSPLLAVTLTFFLWGRGGTKWKTNFLRWLIPVSLAEIIPGIDNVTFYTIMVLWAWLKASNKREDASRTLVMIDKALEGAIKVGKLATPQGMR